MVFLLRSYLLWESEELIRKFLDIWQVKGLLPLPLPSERRESLEPFQIRKVLSSRRLLQAIVEEGGWRPRRVDSQSAAHQEDLKGKMH